MKKFYLSVEDREFVVEASLKLASALEKQGQEQKLTGNLLELVEAKSQKLRQLADLMKVSEHEK